MRGAMNDILNVLCFVWVEEGRRNNLDRKIIHLSFITLLTL